MVKKSKKIKITKITFGLSETKEIRKFEYIKIYNELEAVVGEGDSVAEIHDALVKAVKDMNEYDFNNLLNK